MTRPRRFITAELLSPLVRQRLSDGEIARRLACIPQAISKARRRLGIRALPRGRKRQPNQ